MVEKDNGAQEWQEAGSCVEWEERPSTRQASLIQTCSARNRVRSEGSRWDGDWWGRSEIDFYRSGSWGR